MQFLKQMHELQTNQTDQTPMETAVNWHAQTKHALPEWQAESEIVYVFIPNKTIHNVGDPNATKWPENLIVVHKPCLLTYFGHSIHQFIKILDDCIHCNKYW